MTVISNPDSLQKAHAFAVPPRSHALRAYPNDAGATLATSGRTAGAIPELAGKASYAGTWVMTR